MSVNLDLSSSEAKVFRAREHAAVLKRELPKWLHDHGPYAVRFGDVDPNSGWCEIWLMPVNRQNRTFNVLFGDVVHNLRCALDYIVTALVDASTAQLTTKHQFPIYRDETKYIADVGTITNPKGPLFRVKHGLGLIEQWQPYKLQAQNLDPRTDPLWHVHRFSNADKHRDIVAARPTPVGGINIRFQGIKVEDDPIPEFPPDWSPDQQYVVHRLRFDPPMAYNLRVVGKMSVHVGFSVPAFGAEPFHSIALTDIAPMCQRVSDIVKLFKTI